MEDGGITARVFLVLSATGLGGITLSRLEYLYVVSLATSVLPAVPP